MPKRHQLNPPQKLSTVVHCQIYGTVGFFNSSPSTLALLSAVAGSLNPSAEPVPSLTLTPPLPTLTVRWSADWRSALAPPTG